jgi:hypothetical protein
MTQMSPKWFSKIDWVWDACGHARSGRPELAVLLHQGKMRLALPVLLAASALVAQGDAADDRALLRQRVVAAAMAEQRKTASPTIVKSARG